MKKKKIAGIITAACIVAVLGGTAVFYSRNSSERPTGNISEPISGKEPEDSLTAGIAKNSENPSDTAEEVPFETQDSKEAVLEEAVAADTEDSNSDLPDGNEWRKLFAARETDAEQETNPAQGINSALGTNGTQTDHAISFPYVIPGTDLTIEKVSGYDGIFLEDGSDSEVSGITSIVLKNNGETDVEYADITLNDNGEKLSFKISDIAAGSWAIVQEADKSGYTGGPYADCSADAAQAGRFEMSEDKVRVEENEEGSLTISNLTDEEIPCVRVFYKFYMKEENVYVGGITYTVKVTNLEADGTRKVTPSHYSAGSSKVVMIRTYDTAD